MTIFSVSSYTNNNNNNNDVLYTALYLRSLYSLRAVEHNEKHHNNDSGKKTIKQLNLIKY